jgi:hypothetical protein
MGSKISLGWATTVFVLVVTSVLALPAGALAQTVTGQARAVQASIATPLGISTTALADTGTLSGSGDARDATLDTATIPSLLSAEVLHAVTTQWPDQVLSQVSLTNVGMIVGTTSIKADVVMANALATPTAPASASSIVGNLSINGVLIPVTGAANQRIPIAGGFLTINEQTVSAAGTTVNALHARVAGLADVVLASATAGIR